MYFVLVVGPAGMWLGIISKDGYTNWKVHGHALEIDDVRGLLMQAIPNNPGRLTVNITSPYPGDTKQLTITTFPHSVEIIGEIEDNNGVKTCQGKPTLFNRYVEAVTKWKAALANIHMATPADLANITNITPFSGKQR